MTFSDIAALGRLQGQGWLKEDQDFSDSAMSSTSVVESDAALDAQILEIPTLLKFSPAQIQLLQENVEVVKAQENSKARQRLIKSIRKKILADSEAKNLSVEEKADLASAVNSWFSVRTKRSGNRVKFAKAWTARLAMYEESKQRINERKSSLYEEAKAEGKEPRNAFSYFQLAMTENWDETSREEQQRYRKVAKKWNLEGASKEKKQE
jgi:hypothetical protein